MSQPAIVERVARTLAAALGPDPLNRSYLDVANLALDASHHAELVEVLEEAREQLAATPLRIAMQTSILNKIDRLLAKPGGDV